NKNFKEVELGFSDEQALLEADRCLECKIPKCVEGCPVNVKIPEFIKAVKEGKIGEAGNIIRETNYLPSVCGRICPQERQCERSCILGIKGEAIAIGALERYVGDKTCPEIKKVQATGSKKVAIVGSGCAGMSAAADIAKHGHKVTIFEALHAVGGVLRYGIPEFRLPSEILDREAESLKKLGVEYKTNVIIGKSLTIKDLFQEGYQAVFICSGAGLPKMLHISGENLNNVYSANEFLTRVNLMKANREDFPTPVKIGEKIAVIGGGNTAMDSARVAKRIGFKDVAIIYRRSETELPARKAEVEHAKEEGIRFLMLHSPLEFYGDNEKITGMRLQAMKLGEPDSS
ncbi:MAG: NAD(P)-dependent oxidoreductase, partial [Thermodesulfovibrionia bacterium]|nr:NAD(P)-dependent oxidoreductase [Thermodesulfovibrionia bacterium]